MKAKLKIIDNKKYLMFCVDYGTSNILDGFHCLPVITSGSRCNTNAWTWNGDLENPTLKPSIKTKGLEGIMHCWLNEGKTKMLSDSNIPNKGKTVDLINLNMWSSLIES